MDEKKIRDTLGKIVPDDTQKERMLDAIMAGEARTKRRQLYKALPYIAAAALVLLISFTLYELPRRAPSPVTPPVAEGPGSKPALPITPSPDFPTQSASAERPQLTFSLNESGLGMGYMGRSYPAGHEFTDRNPWTREMALPTLPVFRNTFLVNGAGEPDKVFSPAVKRHLAAEIASLLGTALTDEDNEWSCYMTEEGTEIIVRDDLSVTIKMKAPEFERTDVWKDPAVFEAQVARYYTDRYPALFRIEHPVYEITSQYNIPGDHHLETRIFSRPEDDLDAILNYAFNSYHISYSQEGTEVIIFINIPGPYLFEKVQDYPIISAEEAEAALLRGDYLTTVPYDETITPEEIASTRLVYHTSIYAEYFQPVYEFYVELDDEDERSSHALIPYGIYYVPAISPEYVEVILDNIPFN
jgi:hypothetical protein